MMLGLESVGKTHPTEPLFSHGLSHYCRPSKPPPPQIQPELQLLRVSLLIALEPCSISLNHPHLGIFILFSTLWLLTLPSEASKLVEKELHTSTVSAGFDAWN